MRNAQGGTLAAWGESRTIIVGSGGGWRPQGRPPQPRDALVDYSPQKSLGAWAGAENA